MKPLSQLEPWRVPEEKKKTAPAMPKTLKKTWKNFAEFKIRCLRKKLAQKNSFKRQGGNLSTKKPSTITRNTDRCTEQKFKWQLWHKKSSIYVPRNRNWHFVIRIRGIHGVSAKVWKVLRLLCLSQIFSGTFVKLTCWELWNHGYPNRKSINELICKRG